MQKRKRLVSFILTLALSLSLFAIIPQTALAANTDTDSTSGPTTAATPDVSSGQGTVSDNEVIDSTPPTVIRVDPNGVYSGSITILMVSFNEELNPASGTVTLSPAVTMGSPTWTSDDRTAYYQASNLQDNTTYTYNISGFKDIAGNTMVPISSGFSFKTHFGQINPYVYPISASFNKYTPANVSVTLNPGMYDLLRLTYDGTPLTEGNQYAVNGSTYAFSKKWLATLSNGSHTVTFAMSGGTNPTLALTVKDSTPKPTPTPKPTSTPVSNPTIIAPVDTPVSDSFTPAASQSTTLIPSDQSISTNPSDDTLVVNANDKTVGQQGSSEANVWMFIAIGIAVLIAAVAVVLIVIRKRKH